MGYLSNNFPNASNEILHSTHHVLTLQQDFHKYIETGANGICLFQIYNHIPGLDYHRLSFASQYKNFFKKNLECMNKKQINLFGRIYMLNNQFECKEYFQLINKKYFQNIISNQQSSLSLQKQQKKIITQTGYYNENLYNYDDFFEELYSDDYNSNQKCSQKNHQPRIVQILPLNLQDFVIRAHLLISSINPLIVYIYSDVDIYQCQDVQDNENNYNFQSDLTIFLDEIILKKTIQQQQKKSEFTKDNKLLQLIKDKRQKTDGETEINQPVANKNKKSRDSNLSNLEYIVLEQNNQNLQQQQQKVNQICHNFQKKIVDQDKINFLKNNNLDLESIQELVNKNSFHLMKLLTKDLILQDARYYEQIAIDFFIDEKQNLRLFKIQNLKNLIQQDQISYQKIMLDSIELIHIQYLNRINKLIKYITKLQPLVQPELHYQDYSTINLNDIVTTLTNSNQFKVLIKGNQQTEEC